MRFLGDGRVLAVHFAGGLVEPHALQDGAEADGDVALRFHIERQVDPDMKWYARWSLVSLEICGKTPKASQVSRMISIGWCSTFGRGPGVRDVPERVGRARVCSR